VQRAAPFRFDHLDFIHHRRINTAAPDGKSLFCKVPALRHPDFTEFRFRMVFLTAEPMAGDLLVHRTFFPFASPSTPPMKTFSPICCLSAIFCAVSQATPPVLSLTQVALQKIDAGIRPDHYEIARADLDADGKEDVLALMNGKSSYYGSGGATLFILKGSDKGFTSLGSVKVVNAPIYLRKSATNGYADLVVTVEGGGATPGLTVLSFDGKSYPAGEGEATATLRDDDKLLFSEPIPPFDQTAILQGITFKVTSPNLNSANTLTITPGGLAEDNRPITIEIIGTVTRIETGDINVDGSPEIYINAKDGEGTNLIAYSANQKKSLSQIFLPDLTEDVKNASGYRGHDEFAVVENSLARRFPVFPQDESETQPTGKTRQLQYKLHQGEAGWVLKIENSTEF
jgi:hypothetical protein